MEGYGYKPCCVEGQDPLPMHQAMAATLETVVEEVRATQKDAREHGFTHRPQWPMIVLNSPKGWTGPKVVDGVQIEGTFRAHQVTLDISPSKPQHVELLEQWMKSYHPEELFDEKGTLVTELQELAPKGDRRMGANPQANGGLLLKELRIPNFCDYAVEVSKP